ncbi:Serine/threonine-protein kinase 3 [Echinococcus granulosus]|uniref:Serine/threonine-protein kinase cst-1 n=2 Tax=Echinococcus granulosus TaxID=6210 RepID=A0A068WU35_ECHGR|nr:Serine/threonine-protein kinase 3 [Echinococcus granulosus]CDS22003.1 serine:threonine protein kinase 3 [Echinococcus granulosus]
MAQKASPPSEFLQSTLSNCWTDIAYLREMKRLDESELSKPPSKVLEVICKLGKGSYGSVFKAKHKASGTVVAVKKVPVDSDLSEIVKEISIMQQCDSPYIVKCFGSLFDNQDLWICMEYCGAGSVADIMRLRNQTLTEEEIGTILKYSLLGLDYLHQMRKIHRDIKAGNILLTSSGMAKLADFGVAGQLVDTLAKRNTVIGTPFWMAPEVIQEVGYNCSADIWSLGITAIEMGDGKPPLGDEHPMRALFMIPSQPSPRLRDEKAWSVDFVAFVNSCLARAPEARPSAAALLQTSFIRGAKSCSILLPLIEESNRLREKRLNDSKAAAASTTSPQTPFAKASAKARARPQEVIDIVEEETSNSGTMIQRSGSSSMIVKGEGVGATGDASGTLIFLNRSDRGGTLGQDGATTMVINEDFGAEDDTECSVVIHAGDSMVEKDPGAENAGTLTQNFARQLAIGNRCKESENVAAAVAAAQRACGAIPSPTSPPSASESDSCSSSPSHHHHHHHLLLPHTSGQRPFAPFSRAFHESGALLQQQQQQGMSLFDGGGGVPAPGHTNALALANEPGGLSKLSYSELEQLLVNLGRDLETELRNLAIRYRHKRQPLLDAIAEKTAALAP